MIRSTDAVDHPSSKAPAVPLCSVTYQGIIHGTDEPWTIGTNVSSGCIRMINQDAIDLYARTPTGTNVIVLTPRASARVG